MIWSMRMKRLRLEMSYRWMGKKVVDSAFSYFVYTLCASGCLNISARYLLFVRIMLRCEGVYVSCVT
jgi:hypothetical protein